MEVFKDCERRLLVSIEGSLRRCIFADLWAPLEALQRYTLCRHALIAASDAPGGLWCVQMRGKCQTVDV